MIKRVENQKFFSNLSEIEPMVEDFLMIIDEAIISARMGGEKPKIGIKVYADIESGFECVLWGTWNNDSLPMEAEADALTVLGAARLPNAVIAIDIDGNGWKTGEIEEVLYD